MGAALFVSIAVLGVASSGGHHPNRDYAPFAGCPLSNPAPDICIFAQSENGELTIGSKTIPISRTVTLQGGNIDQGFFGYSIGGSKTTGYQ